MKHIYSPEDYLNMDRLQQELKNIELEAELQKKTPKASSVEFILNYSKALEVKPLSKGISFEQILN